MPQLLPFFILIPFFALLINLFVPKVKERLLSGIAISTVGIHLLGVIIGLIRWAVNGFPVIDMRHIVLYQSPEFTFFIQYYFDQITAVFLWMGSALTFLVTVFSKYYLHREEGFKRFFNTLLVFFAGYNLVILSGNFETLFVGWELLGISSFLLISFYRDRYLPVKNGLKVLSFYRLGDICLMLAMWMSHHLWHKNITFGAWNDAGAVQEIFHAHYAESLFIALMIVVAAAIKSAQLPFSTWLPRAMEGPTTSSAIFYGSLSVHIGAFVLLRTYPFWSGELLIQLLIGGIGLLTSVVASSITRVQSSVKTQIAYSSITQIGLIFIEIAAGFHTLALVHFAGNAILRTYQLLVSPSVLGYMIHDMFFHFNPGKQVSGNSFFSRLKDSVYLLSVKEWNMDTLLYDLLWRPFKWVGKQLRFVGTRWGMTTTAAMLLAGITGIFFDIHLHDTFNGPLSIVCSGLALLLVLAAFSQRDDARKAWLLVIISQLFTIMAILMNHLVEWHQVVIYLSGTFVAGLGGFLSLYTIHRIDQDITLDQYHGYSYERPGIALLFLLSCLGLAGFPITPTFIGIDLMFTHIHAGQVVLIVFTALNFLFLELTLLRIYTRVFLGQHKKLDHPVAFRSS